MSDEEPDSFGWTQRTGDVLREIQRYAGDDVVSAAARHFTSNEIVRRTKPLTPDELQLLAEDDERTFGNRP